MDKQTEVANERAREELYRRALEKKRSRSPDVGVHASGGWTGTGTVKMPSTPDGVLVGRVALDNAPQVSAAGECYIGSAYHQDRDITVYSWAAPIAQIFFTHDGHPLCENVVGRRTFTHDGGRISDFEDEHRRGDSTQRLFRVREMQVPNAPPRALPQAPPRPMPTAPPIGQPAAPTQDAAPATAHTPAANKPAHGGVRAKKLLERNLEKARTGQLESVLATLQPEQYGLVTRDGHDDLIIDGHPGTGKTVIAVHRAAYLTSPEYNQNSGPGTQISKVLVLGPTDEYVAHVAPAIGQLTNGSGEVHVMSLRKLLASASGLVAVPEGRAITRIDDGDAHLWSLAHNAVSLLKRTGRVAGPRSSRIRTAYQLLRSNGDRGSLVTTDDSWAEYLASLPPFEQARTTRAHAPLIAALGWCVEPHPDLRGFDHIIVDEAQDVMAIEWVLLDAINTHERWTILGDMNQRRSDAAHGSWTFIADALALLDSEGKAPVVSMRRGYRSTAPIMEFANKLLPQHARHTELIQSTGAPVLVERTAPTALHEQALAHVHELRSTYPNGTIAIIGMERPVTETYLRQHGWIKEPHHAHRWSSRGSTVDVISPDYARGLEWDAVIVLEPATFPKNFLRHGLLYTSLTRANRELRVLHASPLPEALTQGSRA